MLFKLLSNTLYKTIKQIGSPGRGKSESTGGHYMAHLQTLLQALLK